LEKYFHSYLPGFSCIWISHFEYACESDIWFVANYSYYLKTEEVFEKFSKNFFSSLELLIDMTDPRDTRS
jgi:hypothetical protein